MRHSACTSIITWALRSRRVKWTAKLAKSARRVVTVRCIVNIEGRVPRHLFSRLPHPGRKCLQTRSNCGLKMCGLRQLTTVLNIYLEDRVASAEYATRSRSPNRTIMMAISILECSRCRPCFPSVRLAGPGGVPLVVLQGDSECPFG